MTRVVVAGAGIGGLAAALALADAGLEIAIFDRAAILHEVGAGLQLSPNATTVLARLGVLERILETAVRPEAVRIRRGRDGADLARLPLGAVAEARFAAPFLVTHRADLQSVLLGAARSHPGITVQTGISVEGFRPEGERVVIELKGGPEASTTADGLVGADGLRSRIRALQDRSRSDDRVSCGRTAWRTLLPAAWVSREMLLPESNLWLGRKTHLVHYPVRAGTLVNVVAIVADLWHEEARAPFWNVRGDPGQIQKSFHGWTAEARALIDAAEEWRIWPLFDRPPLQRWSRGPVTLVGDAAHPMLPFLAQGASQAIEDAGALASAVARHPRLPEAFLAYEQARRPKSDRVQREARRQGSVYHLGGPAAAVRDVTLGLLGPERMLARYDWLYGTPAA